MTRLLSTRSAASRARHERGAAMVEALIAIPFFITIFTSILYIGHLYGEKETTLYAAKQGAWLYALSGCQGNPQGQQADGFDVGAQLGQQLGGSGLSGQSLDQQGGNLNTYADQAGGTATKSYSTAVYTSNASVTADKWMGGFVNHLSTTDRVQCNEVPEKGSIGGVLHYAWGLIHF